MSGRREVNEYGEGRGGGGGGGKGRRLSFLRRTTTKERVTSHGISIRVEKPDQKGCAPPLPLLSICKMDGRPKMTPNHTCA